MKYIIATLAIIFASTFASADKPVADRPHDDIIIIPTPQPPQPSIIQNAPGQQCDLYQIRVITTRGNNSIDAETLGYCDLEQAQNVLAQLNASAYRKLPKGQPIYQIAYPLF